MYDEKNKSSVWLAAVATPPHHEEDDDDEHEGMEMERFE